MKLVIFVDGEGLPEKVTLAEWLQRNLQMWGMPATLDAHGYKVEGPIDDRMGILAERHTKVEVCVLHQEKPK